MELAEVKPGMILEMSIVLERSNFAVSEETCPRCDHLNLNVTTSNGWIEW